MASVTFDPAAFKVLFPQFANAANVQLDFCFAQACMILSNADNSPVQDTTKRGVLLNLLTAHIATLAGLANVDPGPSPVGRVASASEGSVSASFDFNVPPNPGQAYFAQTQYGASFWQMTISLRSMRYVSRPTCIP